MITPPKNIKNITRPLLSLLAAEYQAVAVNIKKPVKNKNLFRIVNLSVISIINVEKV